MIIIISRRKKRLSIYDKVSVRSAILYIVCTQSNAKVTLISHTSMFDTRVQPWRCMLQGVIINNNIDSTYLVRGTILGHTIFYNYGNFLRQQIKTVIVIIIIFGVLFYRWFFYFLFYIEIHVPQCTLLQNSILHRLQLFFFSIHFTYSYIVNIIL